MNICRFPNDTWKLYFLDSLAPPSSLSVNSGVSTERHASSLRDVRKGERNAGPRAKKNATAYKILSSWSQYLYNCSIWVWPKESSISIGCREALLFTPDSPCWYATNVLNHAGSPVLECNGIRYSSATGCMYHDGVDLLTCHRLQLQIVPYSLCFRLFGCFRFGTPGFSLLSCQSLLSAFIYCLETCPVLRITIGRFPPLLARSSIYLSVYPSTRPFGQIINPSYSIYT